MLNVVMPKLTGFQAARVIRQSVPQTKVVILSTHADAKFISLARECGAKAYIPKKDAADKLVSAIDAAAQGRELFLL